MAGSSISRIIYVLETLTRIPSYALLGYTFDRIVFLSTREGVTSLWSMDPGSGRLYRHTVESINGAADPRPGSPLLFYIRDVSRGRELHGIFYTSIHGGGEERLQDIPPMRIFSITYNGSKVFFIGSTEREIALYMASPDGSWDKLYTLNTIAFVTDADDKYVVGFGTLRGNPRSYELFIYSLDTGEFKVYTPRENSNNKFPRISSGRILFESNYRGRNRLYVYDVLAENIKQVEFSHKDYDMYDPIEHDSYGWLDNGRIWAVGKRDGRSRLFVDGKLVDTPKGTIHGYPVFLRDKVYVAVSNMVTPTKILEIDPVNGGQRVVVDNELPSDIKHSLGETMFIKYSSFDGLEVPMYVALSNNTPRPGPAIVYVHGGPWSEVRDVWSIMTASLVASGYHVLAPNFRGSTGYGDEYRLMDIGDPGGGDLQDIVYAAKWGVENKIADRVAVMGYSYGGYMTYLALGKHPDLWKCGVAGAGIVDWEEMYGLSDAIFRQFIDVLFAGKRELWRDRSPITYVDNVKAPLCIIHPQNDSRTPLKPVLRYMEKLLDKGKTFEAHITPDMGHMIIKMDDAIKILLPALIFLEKHLKTIDKK